MFETKTFVGQPCQISPPIIGKMWTFGPCGKDTLSTCMRLDALGNIEGYDHPNERSWRIEKHTLLILAENGNVTWRSTRVSTNEAGKLKIILQNFEIPDLFFELKENSKIENLQTSENIEKNNIWKDANFLFPPDLERNKIVPKNILLIGGAHTSFLHQQFNELSKETNFDFIYYEWPGSAIEQLSESKTRYDMQFIQLPLRRVLSDEVIFAEYFKEKDFSKRIIKQGCSVIDTMFDELIHYNEDNKVLTCVSLFCEPQVSGARSLKERYEDNDIVQIIRKFNNHIIEKVKFFKNTYVVDSDAIMSSIGKRYILDDTIYFYGQNSVFYQDWDDFISSDEYKQNIHLELLMPSYKERFAAASLRQLISIYRTVHKIDAVKAVVVDLENTLWRGHPLRDYDMNANLGKRRDGWPMGIWELVHYLKLRDIRVVACGDMQIEPEQWDFVVQPKFLKHSDFEVIRNNKLNILENINNICKEMKVSKSEVVFVSGIAHHREILMKEEPELRILGADAYQIRRILMWAAETQIANLSSIEYSIEKEVKNIGIDEDIRDYSETKNEIRPELVSNVKEKELQFYNNKEKISSFMSTLNCHSNIDIIKNKDSDSIKNISNLLSSGLTLNATGMMWSKEELEKFLENNGEILAFYIRDDFTNYGLSGVTLIHNNEIVQFVMSERVCSMDFEDFMLSETIHYINSHYPDAEILARANYGRQQRNCFSLYKRFGFQENILLDGGSRFILKITEVLVSSPPHIQLE